MAFNLGTFEKLMSLAQAATLETGAVVEQWGSGDHVGAVTAAVQTAGAIAAGASKDPASQQEAAAATSLATSLMPAIFAFASLFAKKK